MHSLHTFLQIFPLGQSSWKFTTETITEIDHIFIIDGNNSLGSTRINSEGEFTTKDTSTTGSQLETRLKEKITPEVKVIVASETPYLLLIRRLSLSLSLSLSLGQTPFGGFV